MHGITIDGICSVGPVVLTLGTLANAAATIPTVVDNAYAAHLIPHNELGVFFAPEPSTTKGELTFGGYDSSKTTTAVEWNPVTQTSPAKYYWGIDQSVRYNGQQVLSWTAGIVDTGTTLILLATGGSVSALSRSRLTVTPRQMGIMRTRSLRAVWRTRTPACWRLRPRSTPS